MTSPKRVLFIVNQLFQLMVVTRIRQTVFQESKADLLLIDNSSGMREVYESIRGTDCFDNIYITKRGTYYSEFERIKLILTQIVDRKWHFFKKFSFIPEYQYDVVFINEFSLFSCMIALYAGEKNNVAIYRHEEGFGSYLNEFGVESKRYLYALQVWSTALKLRGRPSILYNMKGHYYFYPELIQYKTAYKTYPIPPIDVKDDKYRAFILRAYPRIPRSEFDRKYIFFEENITDNSIDDFSLVMKIAEKVGKDNLLVKLHPRRPLDRFSKYGIKVSRATGVPWEAVLMQYDFSDKVVMTISSGVAFSSRLYFSRNIETYMLFKLFDKIHSGISNAGKFLDYVDSFQKIYKDDLFCIPDSIDIFFKHLENTKKGGLAFEH